MDYIGFDKENHFDGFSFYCGDCMELLKQTPDKYYDLCIVDPPYRDSIDNQPTKDMRQFPDVLPRIEKTHNSKKASENCKYYKYKWEGINNAPV